MLLREFVLIIEVFTFSIYILLIGCCSTFVPALPTCPGNTAMFQCTVNAPGNPVIQWNVTGFDVCLLSRVSSPETTCGLFNAKRTGTTGSCFSSILTVIATNELNGTSVQCQLSHETSPVGSAKLNVIGKLYCTLYNYCHK